VTPTMRAPTMRWLGIGVCVGLLAVSCGDETASPASSEVAQTQVSNAPVEPSDPVVAPTDTSATTTTSTTTATTTTTSAPWFSELSEQLFDQTVLHEIDIEISDEDLALLDPPTDDRVPVRLTVDGSTLDDAGLRLKRGFGQFQGLDGKPGFSIETDEFVDGATLFDVDRFTLGNAVWDHAFVNEQLVYELYRTAGLPAPRTALARVTVNGETFGLYVMRETYDERSLAQHFADPTGNLYESSGPVGGLDTGLDPRTNKRSGDTSDLAAVAEVVATASGEEYRDAIGELVDVDQLLTYWAIEALAGHWDGYAYDLTAPDLFPGAVHPPTNPFPNNFYLYHDPTSDRFVFLPHGADLTLGIGSWSTYEVGPATPVLLPPKVDASIAARLWEYPAFRDELAERIRWVLDEVWDVPALSARSDLVADLVRADGLTGSREFVTMSEFESTLAHRKDFLTRRPEAVRAELATWESEHPQGQDP
jgi:spore coat protein H